MHSSFDLHSSLGKQHDVTERAVIQRASAGDDQAKELIIRRYAQRLFRVARSIVRNDDEAAEVVERTYGRAFEESGQFSRDQTCSTWLIRIAIHEALAGRTGKAAPLDSL